MKNLLDTLKNWGAGALKSWTIWFSVTGIPLLMWLHDNVEVWQEYVGNYTNLILVVIGVALRLKTNKSLDASK